MRKRFILVILSGVLMLSIPGSIFGQTGPDLTPLYNELGVLFEEIGNDTVPHIQQFGLIMEGTGAAEIGPHFFFSLTAGSVFTNGILTFRAGDNPFSIFDINQLLTENMTDPDTLKYYDQTKTFFLNPGMRLSLGFGLKNGLEFLGHFGMIPQAATDGLLSLTQGSLAASLPPEIIDMLGAGITFNRFNAGGRVRKVLMSDQGGFPAVSVSAGYTYTQFNLGLPSLESLPLDNIDLSGFKLGLSGSLGASTKLHTAGIELGISKKLLFFVPFARFGAWYQWTNYEAGISDLEITLSSDALPTDLTASGTDPVVTRQIRDMSFVPSLGFELAFGKFSLIVFGMYNTSSGSLGANASLQFRI